MTFQRFLVLIIVGCCMISGCARLRPIKSADYETVMRSGNRDARVAKRKHEKALDAMCCDDYCKAEEFIREALLADVSFGPAHNTLGKIYFEQGKNYLAAWEFEYASRLMPERTEPINNLGLVFESAGQYEKAIQYFEQANSESPDTAQYLGNLLRARFRRGDRTSDMRAMFEQLIYLDSRQTWRDWAKKQLVMGGLDEYGDYIEYSFDNADPIEQPPLEPDGYFADPEVGNAPVEDGADHLP